MESLEDPIFFSFFILCFFENYSHNLLAFFFVGWIVLCPCKRRHCRRFPTKEGKYIWHLSLSVYDATILYILLDSIRYFLPAGKLISKP